MHFLINCSNLKAGGGLQVADSICCLLNRYSKHFFIVVLSDFLEQTRKKIYNFENVKIYKHDIPNTFETIIMGRDHFLDSLLIEKEIDAVITVFGPSRWCPRVPHLSGFALPQLVLPESPFFAKIDNCEKIKWYWWRKIREWSIKRSADFFWTENPMVTERLSRLFHNTHVYTVTNYYNQVFDHLDQWKRTITLPEFEGITCLSVSSPASHKNFSIIEHVVRVLRQNHPEMKIRFVLTFDEKDLRISEDVSDSYVFVGKTDVSECPYLYEQADVMFMPTLLECFTATYPEAMRMEVPIVTTDLDFARGLCGDAACYYSATDAQAAADAIYKVATDKEYARKLVSAGKEQLKKFDNYEQRAEKLVKLLETIASKMNQPCCHYDYDEQSGVDNLSSRGR